MDDNDLEKTKRIQSIQYQYAFELFCQKRFEDSFKIFSDLATGVYLAVLPNVLTAVVIIGCKFHISVNNCDPCIPYIDLKK